MKLFTFFILIIFTIPQSVFAHTRWFKEHELPPFVTTEPTELYLSVLAGVALLIVVIGYFLEKYQCLQLSFLDPKSPVSFLRVATRFSILSGAFFLNAGTHGYLFSPNLTAEAGVPTILLNIELLIGLVLLAGVYVRYSAFLLGLVWFCGFTAIDPLYLFENVWVISASLFIIIVGNEYFDHFSHRCILRFARRYQKLALPILRIGVGLTLFILGFSEKILHPELGVNFLNHHDWNFMSHMGLPFTNYMFVLAAGSVEALFGLVFILGFVTRLNALVVAIFFTIPLFILGPMELSGHLPHFVAVVLLLVFGSGRMFSKQEGRVAISESAQISQQFSVKATEPHIVGSWKLAAMENDVKLIIFEPDFVGAQSNNDNGY